MESFDSARKRLEKQYEHVVYDPESGLDEEGIRKLFEAHCRENPHEKHILSKAFLLHLVCTKARIAPEPDNFFAGKVDPCVNLFQKLRWKWLDEVWEKEFSDHSVPQNQKMSVVDMDHSIGYMIDTSHTSPDWPAILKLGFPGLRDRAARGNTPLHRAAEMVYDGAIELCRRLGNASGNEALLALAERPPQTLREAFQLAYLFHDLQEIEGEEVRTMGWFDRLYIDFYRGDLKAGRLTRESAKELIKYFWIAFYAKWQGTRFGKNFCFGPEINELSYLGMEVYHEMNTVDPKLSVRVTADTPLDFLELAAKNIRDGRNGIVFLNDKIVIQGLVKHGRSREDAENFIPIGCYEPAVLGKEISTSGATHVYLPAIVLQVLRSGKEYSSFEAFKQAYFETMKEDVLLLQQQQCRCEKLWPEVNPSPFLSGSFKRCMETGRDVSQGGVEYNSTGCVISFFAEAVDSLAAVEYLVYRQKLCTLPELREALAADWNGWEALRMSARNRAPKWGNNDERADQIGREIAEFVSPLVNGQENARGGHLFASLYGQLVVERGKQIGALPDGRKAGTPVSKNMDACIPMDKNGITSLMNSVLKLDYTAFPCGTCLDLMLHPSAVHGEEGIAVLVAIIRSFIARGGSGLQFNIFDSETLRDAQRHPEKYTNLQVRVCGWNVRFTDLKPEEQNTFIAQAEGIA